MNLVTLSGRLTKDPELRYTQTGKAVIGFTLAVDNGFGENKQTAYIPCTAWEKTAEIISNTLVKGRKIFVQGEWRQRSYKVKDGQKRRADECLVRTFEYGDSKKQESGSSGERADMSSFGRDISPDEEILF